MDAEGAPQNAQEPQSRHRIERAESNADDPQTKDVNRFQELRDQKEYAEARDGIADGKIGIVVQQSSAPRFALYL